MSFNYVYINSEQYKELDDVYLQYLTKHIPILEVDKYILLNMIIDYCIEPPKYGRSAKIIIKTLIIRKINTYLDTIRGKLNAFQNLNLNTEIITTSEKIIKKQKLTALSLIEGIINCTLNYYEKDIPINEHLTVYARVNRKNQNVHQLMNIAHGISLYEYIQSTPSNEDLLATFQNIARVLVQLQTSYEFIHGDFHAGNIFIRQEDGKITIIDFGYSTIKLPTKTTKIILSSPVDANLNSNSNLHLTEEEGLKAVDLFVLFEQLNKSTTIKLSEDNRNLITSIQKKYREKYNLENLISLHKLESMTQKLCKTDKFIRSKFIFLYPINFNIYDNIIFVLLNETILIQKRPRELNVKNIKNNIYASPSSKKK